MATVLLTRNRQVTHTLDITSGPNNFQMAAAMFLVAVGDEESQPLRYFRCGDDLIAIRIKSVEDTSPGLSRKCWRIRGKLANYFSDQATIGNEIEVEYDSYRRIGKIFILAHEEPKPLIEMLEWGEMIARIQTDRLGDVIEMRWEATNETYRGIIQSAEWQGVRFQIECELLYQWRDNAWIATTDRVLRGMVSQETDDPLAFADGRIVFKDDRNLTYTFTVFPSKKISW